MIEFTTGNLLEAKTEALVNTVNTVGVMGKGIALMFKDRFPENYQAYEAACEDQRVEVGRMFVTAGPALTGPKWIVNFPTKKHWRNPSKLEWIRDGLRDLRNIIEDLKIKSIALPPLGSGNGGLEWKIVKLEIEEALSDLDDVDIVVYEPTATYQNVAKRTGVQKLTPARAMIAELMRRYAALGFECSKLEVQKLAYFLSVSLFKFGLPDVLGLKFEAHRYGPYSDSLRHMLEQLDGSYIHCNKRISDAGAFEPMWFDHTKTELLDVYLHSSSGAKQFLPALDYTTNLIQGFESPVGMELLSTVHWLLVHGTHSNQASIREALSNWQGGNEAAERKNRIFTDKMLTIATQRISEFQ